MNFPLECIAHGSGPHWQAICLDLDIAVQGSSLHEVTQTLQAAVTSYVEDAMAQEEPVRGQLLNRTAPLSVRAVWAFRLFLITLFHRGSARARNMTIGFAVDCPA